MNCGPYILNNTYVIGHAGVGDLSAALAALPPDSIRCVATKLPEFGGDVLDSYVAEVVDLFSVLRPAMSSAGVVCIYVPETHVEVRVTLDAREAVDRFDTKRAFGVTDRAVNLPREPRLNDMLAAAAERYVAALLGRRHDNHSYIGGDICDVWFHGRKIDVKWTPRDNGRLLAPLRQTIKDIYVLVTGATPETFAVRGWVTGLEFRKRVGNLGHCDNYICDQSELRPMRHLLALSGHPKKGELAGLPWRVALALSSDGWWLRQSWVLDKGCAFLLSVGDDPWHTRTAKTWEQIVQQVIVPREIVLDPFAYTSEIGDLARSLDAPFLCLEPEDA